MRGQQSLIVGTYEGKYFKSIFLLALVDAIIRHKDQGATLAPKVVIDICDAFALGLIYVFLSRMYKEYVMLPKKLIVQDFNPMKHIVQYNRY